jgi:hypothetical protein
MSQSNAVNNTDLAFGGQRDEVEDAITHDLHQMDRATEIAYQCADIPEGDFIKVLSKVFGVDLYLIEQKTKEIIASRKPHITTILCGASESPPPPAVDDITEKLKSRHNPDLDFTGIYRAAEEGTNDPFALSSTESTTSAAHYPTVQHIVSHIFFRAREDCTACQPPYQSNQRAHYDGCMFPTATPRHIEEILERHPELSYNIITNIRAQVEEQNRKNLEEMLMYY